MSLIKMRKSKGASTLPCGTPAVVGKGEEMELRNLTLEERD